ncbi:MAG: hypothetical protein LBI96_00950, partial [Odoribacteraceae bacterium]|nr:hypothetical protein [Odoribacteraceae bacterium]
MRNIILRVGIALLITNVFASCIEDNAEYNGKCFYYVEGQKIFLQRKENMILIKFSTNTTYEQFTALVGRDTSLQPRSGSDWGSFPEGYYLNPVILETKNGQDIPVATIKSFMNNPEVVSVTYMYLYQEENVLQGITDEFTVKRKSTTSYSQLQ